MLPRIDVLPTNQLDLVRPLWEELNRHHLERSRHFRRHFDTSTFEERKRRLLQNSIELFVEVAVEHRSEDLVGYCISSVDTPQSGAVQSIYIREAYRRSGVGARFMTDALAFFQDAGISDIAIKVAAGNESAFEFYARFDFVPYTYVLKRKEP